MNCIYCRSKRQIIKDKPMEKLFSDEEILRLIRMAGKAGFNTVHITGGEPMVRPGMVRLLERIRDYPRVEKLILSTNGSLMTEGVREEVNQYIDEIHVSIDAMQAFDFANICGMSQCMNEIFQCVWTACAAGIQTRITCMLIENARPHIPVLGDLGKKMDFDICFKELAKGSYESGVIPLDADEVLDILGKRYGSLEKTSSEDPLIDYYRTSALKSRIGIVHTNRERSDMVYLAPDGVLYCGKRMRRMIDLKLKLENGASYDDFACCFEEQPDE